MKFVIVTVGGSPEPVVNTVNHYPTAHIVFVASDGEKGSVRTIEEKTVGWDGRQVEPLVDQCGIRDSGRYTVLCVTAPDELDRTLAELDALLEIVKGAHPTDVIANYTGGTKTMSVALAMFASFHHWNLEIRTATRTDLIKVAHGDSRLRQSLDHLVGRRAQQTAAEMSKRGDFDGAAGLLSVTLDDLSADAPRREVESLRSEAQFYAAWNRFDFEAAEQHFPRLSDEEKRTYGHLKSRVSRALNALKSTDALPDGIRDDLYLLLTDVLLPSVRRCVESDRYDDAASRLYRATELLAQIRLRESHDIATNDVPLELSATGRVGAFDAWKLLDTLNDPLGEKASPDLIKMRGWLNVRNDSWLAHGFEPVTRKTWDEQCKKWLAWLEEMAEFAARNS